MIDPYAQESIDTQCLGCVSSEDAFLILWNSGDQTCGFTLPGDSHSWKVLLDTSMPEKSDPPFSEKSLDALSLAPHSLKVLTGKEK